MYPAARVTREQHNAGQVGSRVRAQVSDSTLAGVAVLIQHHAQVVRVKKRLYDVDALTLAHLLLTRTRVCRLRLWSPRAGGLQLRLEAIPRRPHGQQPIGRGRPLLVWLWRLRQPHVGLTCVRVLAWRQNVLPLLPVTGGPQFENGVRLGGVALALPVQLRVGKAGVVRHTKQQPPPLIAPPYRRVLPERLRVDTELVKNGLERLLAVYVKAAQARRAKRDAHVPVWVFGVEGFGLARV